ncbi:MAG TPA: hypothetical protein VJ063_19655 [Verrucomicrobiae bacterium]|nr:hypothetical protein [Verrucomicrobiae bacterium]
MKVIVQRTDKKLFLRERNEWTGARNEAIEFATALAAIGYCIRSQIREIRLVGKNETGEDVYLYPFGGGPSIKLKLRNMRKHIRESRRLKAERRAIQARIDILLAEAKETKKKVPFKREPVAEQEPGRSGV